MNINNNMDLLDIIIKNDNNIDLFFLLIKNEY